MEGSLHRFLYSSILVFSSLSIEAHSVQVDRIINGAIALRTQFPYQVFYDTANTLTSPNWKGTCGGTIISKSIVLTAAHCANMGFKYARLHFGAFNRTNTDEIGHTTMIVSIYNFVLHERYEFQTLTNDIALIRLPTELEFNEFIQPAMLPKTSDPKDLTNQRVVISGWGVTAGGSSPILNYYISYIYDIKQCNRIHMLHTGWSLFNFEQTRLCSAPGTTNSICGGDSGGPMAMISPTDNAVTVVGIASFVLGKYCIPTNPSYFTRVSPYLSWIKKNAGCAIP